MYRKFSGKSAPSTCSLRLKDLFIFLTPWALVIRPDFCIMTCFLCRTAFLHNWPAFLHKKLTTFLHLTSYFRAKRPAFLYCITTFFLYYSILMTCSPIPMTCGPNPMTRVPNPMTCGPNPMTCGPNPMTCDPNPMTCCPNSMTCDPNPMTGPNPMTCGPNPMNLRP